jgi:hypothetical protein
MLLKITVSCTDSHTKPANTNYRIIDCQNVLWLLSFERLIGDSMVVGRSAGDLFEWLLKYTEIRCYGVRERGAEMLNVSL